MTQFRTKSGGRIDRTRPVEFEFDGERLSGFAGDTLASALLANGIHLMGRSFKYHRPRGVLGAGPEEPNALVGLWRDAARYTPNLRATTVELYAGLKSESQNRSPSLKVDKGSVNSLLSPFIPAGFYYKTFMWPKGAWKSLYEPAIREAAGLGRAPTLADPDRYANRHAHCDVLIVGAGPAGVAAALAAASSGARVILCDEQAEMGGSLLAETAADIDGIPAGDWLAKSLAALAREPRVILLPRTTAFGYFPHNHVALNQKLTDHLENPANGSVRERLWQIRAKQVLIAAGAIERPLVFPGNDLPGILLASAGRTYLNRYGVRVGDRVAVVTSHDAAYQTAFELQDAGSEIAVIAEIRSAVEPALLEAARGRGIRVQLSSTVLGTAGKLRVTGITLGTTGGADVQPGAVLGCDAVLMSGGYTPSVHLHSQSRGKLDWNETLAAFVPGQPAEATLSAGSCRGVFGLEAALNDGASQGAAAVRAMARPSSAPGYRARESALLSGGFLGALPQPGGKTGKKAFVDWQNDVTTRDLALAIREGFVSVEHVKRYTTNGMATDQGKTSNMNALAFVAASLGRPIPECGLTTFRMPYTPVTFGSFAGYSRGDLFDPIRRTAIHDWAKERAAVFEDVGNWKRARYFPRGGEDMHAAVNRECVAVRHGCGIFDASTLGKIEVVGRDAATFLERLYVNSWSNLKVGRSRYGILCREDGFVYDDGVIARLAEDRFHVTTTTGGAARVYAFMEDYLQTEWSDLSVWLTSITEQYSVIAVQGPNARRVLEPLLAGVDLSAAAMPHMAVAEGTILGVPMRLFRVSFTGELGFEVNVPSDYGRAVWEAIYAAGESHGIVPYGTEAMHVLRAEKGYIIVGQDTDGTLTPDDAGLGWAVGKQKPDFVGKRSLARASMHTSDRKELVGLRTADPNLVLEEGAQVVETPGQTPPMRLIGHVTSSYHSAVLGHSIAMAVVRGGRARVGQTLYIPMPDGDIPVTVTSTVFYDTEGTRIHG
jgi:sarcosine oxidase, subunit alpha